MENRQSSPARNGHGSPRCVSPCANSLHPQPMHPSVGSGRRGSINSLHMPANRPDSGGKSYGARSRWKILAKTLKRIRKGSLPDEDKQSSDQPFRFPAFEVVDIRPDIAPTTAMDRLWLRITAPNFDSQVDVKVCTRLQSLKLQDLTGFNNTGNICVWPSEEVMAGFCMENRHLFKDKNVLELGAGMTGLAGLIIAQTCSPHHVLITDGNENSTENLEIVIAENKRLGLIEPDKVSSRLVKWANGSKDLKMDYDVIICADCLFFDEGRPQLLECLKKALRGGGTAIIVAPSRSGTFEDFVTLTRESQLFVVSAELTEYSTKVMEVSQRLKKDPRFIPNLHYPRVLRLEKAKHH